MFKDKLIKNRMKGDVGFLPLFLVIMLIMIFIIATMWALANLKFQLNTKFNIDIKADDRGTWALSFLQTDLTGTNYLQALGSSVAENHLDFLEPEFNSIQNTLEKLRKAERFNRSVSVQGRIKIGNPEQGSERFLIDIPVPGGEKKQLEIR